MPESAVAESAPAQQIDPADAFNAGAIANFERAAKAQATNAVPPNQAPPNEEPAAQPDKVAGEKTKAKATAKESPKGDIPEHFLTGEKPNTEAKTETVTDDDKALDEPPPGLSQKAQANWKLLREREKTARLERDSIRKELEAAKATPKVDDAQLKAIAKERDELREALEKSSFERSPHFQGIVKREQHLLEAAKAALKGTEISPEIIDLAARAQGPMRRKILDDAGLDANLRADVTPYLARLDELSGEKATSLENYKQILADDETRQKAQKEQMDRARQEEENKVFREVGERVAKAFELYQKADGYDKWNAKVDERMAAAQKFFNGTMELEEMAEIAYYGIGAKDLHALFHDVRDQLKAAKAEIAKLTAGQPGAGAANNGTFVPSNDASGGDDIATIRARDFERAAAQNRGQ